MTASSGLLAEAGDLVGVDGFVRVCGLVGVCGFVGDWMSESFVGGFIGDVTSDLIGS
jgi:hypothetical protein